MKLFLSGGLIIPIWGKIDYNIIDNVMQTEETGIFYAYTSFDRNIIKANGGVGINLWGWFGMEWGYSSEDYSIYFSVGFTPWLSSSSSIGLYGITSTYGFTNGDITHEFSIRIG